MIGFGKMLWVYSVREMMRQRCSALLMGVFLALTTAVFTAHAMVTAAMGEMVERAFDRSADLVVRRVEPWGWGPIPVDPAVALIGEIPGALRPRPRIWGSARAPSFRVTVMAVDERIATLFEAHGLPLPVAGEAVVGAGVTVGGVTKNLELRAVTQQTVRIVGILPREIDALAHDTVVLAPSDAQQLLNIPKGFATDIIVDVFHETESTQIAIELRRALPWNVHVVQKQMARATQLTEINHMGAWSVFVALPSALGLMLLMAITVRQQIGRRTELGLLKALGWDQGDIVRCQLLKALWIGLPATALGLTGAYGAVFWTDGSWVLATVFGWGRSTPPPLALNPLSAIAPGLQTAALVFIPYLVAAVWSAVVAATADPMALFDDRVR